MTENPKIAFIIHGEIFRIDSLYRKIKRQFSQKFELFVLTTSKSQNAIQLTQNILEKDVDFLVAVGGDGTINEVINGFMLSCQKKTVPIGILPYGRGNDFVRTFGGSQSLKKLYKSILAHEVVFSDVGRLTFKDPESKTRSRYFINIADIGIGGVVTQYLRTSGRRYNSSFIYFSSIIKAFFTYRHQEVSVKTEDWSFHGPIVSLVMANGKYFAQGLGIAPHAKIDDGIAEIIIFGKVGIWDYLKNISALKRAKPLNHNEVLYRNTKRCEITSQYPCPIDADGEFVGYTPVLMEMMPQAIVLINH